MKTYTMNYWGNQWNIFLSQEKYDNNGRLAVLAFTTDDGEYFGDITVNLDDPLPIGDYAFVDTNNSPWAVELLEKNGIAQPTGGYARSGFCLYPVYKFDLSKLEKSQF